MYFDGAKILDFNQNCKSDKTSLITQANVKFLKVKTDGRKNSSEKHLQQT